MMKYRVSRIEFVRDSIVSNIPEIVLFVSSYLIRESTRRDGRILKDDYRGMLYRSGMIERIESLEMKIDRNILVRNSKNRSKVVKNALFVIFRESL